ncbi:LysR family transcriptional regulator [Caldimonas brevitalea]|uniref:Transcriptional regulator, LysR family n=1 Tax=Caldimonas brevitalea TaxID=413882 RepID=A0A0G3BFS0_9BURK|nr:LysR family transcriptional regulator [Caldimonas brevitalea]AKJ28192.1 transcriptional regulator, LysR family [Caldimonas brevitalea]
MDRLTSMRAFAKVIDEGGFAAAARAMDVSAAAVTRLIADLENHLKVRLIHRSTRRLALTDTGQGYLERVRSILQQLEEAEAQVDAAVRQPQGELKIRLPAATLARQLTQHLPLLRRQFPELSLSFTVAGSESTADAGWDVALLLGGDAPPPGLDNEAVVRALARGAGLLCASPAYVERLGMPRHPSELAQHQCLLAAPGDAAGRVRWALQGQGETVELETSAAFSSAHPDTLYAAALGGLGVVGLPAVLLEDALAEGALVQLLPQWRTPTFTLYAAMPSRKFVPSRTRAFMNFLVEAYTAPASAM